MSNHARSKSKAVLDEFRTAKSLREAREKRENIEGLKGWLCVMTIATLAGFAIAYAAKHWF